MGANQLCLHIILWSSRNMIIFSSSFFSGILCILLLSLIFYGVKSDDMSVGISIIACTISLSYSALFYYLEKQKEEGRRKNRNDKRERRCLRGIVPRARLPTRITLPLRGLFTPLLYPHLYPFLLHFGICAAHYRIFTPLRTHTRFATTLLPFYALLRTTHCTRILHTRILHEGLVLVRLRWHLRATWRMRRGSPLIPVTFPYIQPTIL